MTACDPAMVPDVPVLVRLIEDNGQVFHAGQMVPNRGAHALTWESPDRAVRVVRAEAEVPINGYTWVVPLPFRRRIVPCGGTITLTTPPMGHWVCWRAS